MVSIYDIAKEVGLSASTVSLVLSGRGEKMRISRETERLILETANRMGYIPNMSARKLRTSKARHIPEIALCWSPTQHSLFLNTFINVLQDMISSGEVREMRFIILPYKNGELEKLESILITNYFNGIVVPPVFQEDIDFLKKTNIQVPVVALFGDIDQYNLVSVDNRKVGKEVAEIFHRHGHHRVGIMQSEEKKPALSVEQRRSSFLNTCQAFKMEAEEIRGNLPGPVHNKVEEGKILAEKMIKDNDIPTALFIQNDLLAIGAISVFSEQGINIPEDMEIIVYGVNDMLEINNPPITSISYPTGEISRECILLMDKALNRPGTKPVRKIIDTRYVFRESCLY
ncbi:MAG TPA: LacI family transcriptional regulator [Halanaerobiaceae bacterium]|jgi:LacI family transcriptional regulator|nr:LacI family transcriptional regulator [Halanaerobiaceae bacterium]HOA39943.1 LacI family DNA-binding transcriptional regulator [Halanaerobiales bacterium]HPZ62018.1 LacI family DNA-binding transcriptional regulator [Halanaerobiales bacterium]HQD03258.1 LacI family DNA-binding transcriptional regulator [Halanaerobiales bacterium]